MKLAVFSDIQANYPALETVTEHILAWSPDLVIMNGDLVNRGPRSLDCLNLFESLREKYGWIAIRGNHEEFVLRSSHALGQPYANYDEEMQQFTHWTCDQMGKSALKMEKWVDDYSFSPTGAEHAKVSAMHGSLLGNRVGILAKTTDEELADRVPNDAKIFLTAHTHRPLVKNYNGCKIVNVGSAGSPFDGDPRASYAQLTLENGAWNTEIVRLEYDRKAADKDYTNSGFLDEGGAIAKLIYVEWKHAQGMLMRWKNSEQFKQLKNGEVTLQESVDQFIEDRELI